MGRLKTLKRHHLTLSLKIRTTPTVAICQGEVVGTDATTLLSFAAVAYAQYLHTNHRAGSTSEAENFGVIAIRILASLVFALAFTDEVVISGIGPLLWFG